MQMGYRAASTVGAMALALGASGCSSSHHSAAARPAASTTTSAAVASTTTTMKPAPTTVAPAPTSTTAGRPDVTLFAGYWYQHGANVTINRDGTGNAVWRVYSWCQDDPTPPCDGVQQNGSESVIINGGHAQFRVVAVNRYEATFEITGSTEPTFIPNGRVQFVLHKHDEMSIGNRGPFCGPKAPAEACGA
jgi:hypothetical protein